jgi:adenylate cyclase
LPEEKKAIERRGTDNAEAYNLYLLARRYWVTGNHGDARREERVMRICSRAVEIDPYYADAWALLALAQSSLRYSFGRDIDDGFAAANTALSIDPDIPQARLPIVKRHQQRGNHERAATEMEKAILLGSDSWEVNREAGRYFLNHREVEAATRHYERAVELVDDDFHSWAMLSTCYLALGDKEKVRDVGTKMVSEAQRAVQQDPSNGAALGILAGGYALQGDLERAHEWIDRAMLVDPDNLNMRYNFACVLASYADDAEGSIKLLLGILPVAAEALVRTAVVDPDLDPLRNDARFVKALNGAIKRLGIETPDLATSPAQP